MLEILDRGVAFWMDLQLLNARGVVLNQPAPLFAPVQAASLRFRRPDQNRQVSQAPLPGAMAIGGQAIQMPVQTLPNGVWAVDNTSRGVSKDEKKNFRWLPYWPGYITYTDIMYGTPIVTGPMTGCLIAIFTIAGRRYLGHLGTFMTPNTPETIAVKNAWKFAAGTGQITLEEQVNPTALGAGQETFAALSATGGLFYSIEMFRRGGGIFEVVDKRVRIGDPQLPYAW